MKLSFLSLIIGLVILGTSCGGEEVNLISVEQYIAENNIEVEETASGLMYTVESPGNDEIPTEDDIVTVKYKGTLTDDFVFDASVTGAEFPVSGVISGWKEGLQLFGKGGKGVLYIPSNIAYGNNSPSDAIPANADLIFEIELLNWEEGEEEEDLQLISIEDYILQNSINALETASGLKYTIEEAGGDEKPGANATATVKYSGFRTDGFVFDASPDGSTFSLDGVIEGWQEGLQLFGRGGKGVLYIPTDLAYGDSPPSTEIPANADLIFQIELVDF